MVSPRRKITSPVHRVEVPFCQSDARPARRRCRGGHRSGRSKPKPPTGEPGPAASLWEVSAIPQNGAAGAFWNFPVTSPDSSKLSGLRIITEAPGARSNFERVAQNTLGLFVISKK
jgi:hypothetical protein